MKISLLFVIVLGALDLYASEGFRCIPNERDTRLQVLVHDQEIQVLVQNPSGYEMMPQFDGPQSVFNLKWNNMQGEDLKDLGASFAFAWDKVSCRLNADQFSINCLSAAKGKVQQIAAMSLSTTEVTEKYAGQTAEKRKFRMTLENGNIYFLALTFDTKTCGKF